MTFYVQRNAAVLVCVLLLAQFPFAGSSRAAGRTCAGRRATMVGTNGRDRLRGTPGQDVVVAGGGNDVIITGPGHDLVCAGSGNDGINGGGGNDRILGQGGKDLILGGAGLDVADGGPGNDLLMGMGADDRLLGGSGKYDIVSYYFACSNVAPSCKGVSVNLKSDRARGEGRDVLRSIEAIEASRGPDKLRGDGGRNIMWGLGDWDTLRGMGGRDVLVGGTKEIPGNQRMFGGPGRDLLIAFESYQTFAYGDSGNDRIHLRRSIYRSTGNGGGGEDVLVGKHDTADLLFGDAGPDRLYGRGGEDALNGGAGQDVVVGGPQDDEIRGGSGDDLMSGDPGADAFDIPGSRHDPEAIHGGIDTVSYEESPHGVIVNLEMGTSDAGEWGGDQFLVESPVEVIIGSPGDDQLTGSPMDDVLYGHDGDDQLYGLDGADTLSGDDGADSADGGPGEDECDAETRAGCEDLDILPVVPPLFSLAGSTRGLTAVGRAISHAGRRTPPVAAQPHPARSRGLAAGSGLWFVLPFLRDTADD